MDGGDPDGGSAALVRLIDQYGEHILADFQSEYGLNLVKVIRPDSGYSPKQVLSLIQSLPPESRTVAAIRGGPEFLGWGADRYLMAALIDAVNQNTFAFVSANSKKKPKPPQPVPRPSVQESKGSKPNMFALMAKAHMAKARPKGG